MKLDIIQAPFYFEAKFDAGQAQLAFTEYSVTDARELLVSLIQAQKDLQEWIIIQEETR